MGPGAFNNLRLSGISMIDDPEVFNLGPGVFNNLRFSGGWMINLPAAFNYLRFSGGP